MPCEGNIVIADWSAYHLHCHSDGSRSFHAETVRENPLADCASTANPRERFNVDHPLYGGAPVSLLVADKALRRSSSAIDCRYCAADLPPQAFLRLREGLYVAGPELTFARLANYVGEMRLAEIGMTLCARYFTRIGDQAIVERSSFATTPEKIRRFLCSADGLRGAGKALHALRNVAANSGSPAETKMKLQFSAPLNDGSFGLPFEFMNYVIKGAGNRAGNQHLTEQGSYCVDLASPEHRTALEYDGQDYHEDASHDKRRRNALKALGWEVFPVDKSILYNPDATERLAYQVARHMGRRIRKPRCWESKFVKLRTELELPV